MNWHLKIDTLLVLEGNQIRTTPPKEALQFMNTRSAKTMSFVNSIELLMYIAPPQPLNETHLVNAACVNSVNFHYSHFKSL